MKKVAILTFHDVINYGAVLQTYALQKKLEQLGAEAEVIDYVNESPAESRAAKTSKSLSQFARERIKMLLMFSANRRLKKKFADFRLEKLHLTSRRYASKEALGEIADEYDEYIVGSDQVWNPKLTSSDDAFYLSFVKNDEKKHSYAASIGIHEVPQEDLQALTTNTATFQSLSVRENEARELLEKHLSRKVEVHLDPTLLLNKDQWLEVASPSQESGYILVYAIQAPQKLYQFAAELSRREKLPVKVIAMGLRRSIDAEYIQAVGPQEFLRLFANARYVVTNSFHGLAFSINMQKDFFLELLSGHNKPNSRLTNLLSMLELESRVIADGACDAMGVAIDYTKVNQILAHAREDSVSYLRSIIQNAAQ